MKVKFQRFLRSNAGKVRWEFFEIFKDALGGDILFKKNIAIRLMLAIIVLNFSAANLFAAEDKIGFIDSTRVLASHPKYEILQKQLDEFIKKKTDEAKTAAEKEKDPAKRMEIIETARRESGAEEMRVMNPITDEINKVIETVAKSRGVTIVLNKLLIYYGGIDITEDVINNLKKLK
jgi:outer membrane protein